MDYFVVCLVALLASSLTFFSGFGLGTLLLPAFAFFFPIDIAIALTAIVHLLNNIFKLYLVGRHADKKVVLRFGIPAILAAFVGAWLLLQLADMQQVVRYTLFERVFEVTPVNMVIALLMVIFAIVEILPYFNRLSLSPRMLPAGGVLSGFFGGLSGHQGALRSAFLIKCGLSKEGFIGTGVVIACLIDFSRLLVYSSHYAFTPSGESAILLIAATLAAFVGAYLGNKLLNKITLGAVRVIVAIMLFLIAIGLGMGLI